MAAAVNPSTTAGIIMSSAVGAVAEWLRRITVRVNGSNGTQGSGIIWSAEGLIVTNAHVANTETQKVEFFDGRRMQGWVVACDRRRDLAALAVSATNLGAASVRSARTLRAGEMVIAMGNPWDGVRAVSTGIVHHAVGHGSLLAADVRLAPGNSGGPLADAEGNVVGVNSMVIGGFGYAITSDAVEKFLARVHLAEAV